MCLSTNHFGTTFALPMFSHLHWWVVLTSISHLSLLENETLVGTKETMGDYAKWRSPFFSIVFK